MMDIREVFVRQHKRVYRMALLYLKNVSDAEDAVQNVFLKYMEKEIVFENEQHEQAWFLTVTRNYCKDQFKSFWNRFVDMGEIPEAAGDEREEGKLLEYIMKLPQKYKEVLYLYYYEEYSVKEMAAMLSRKESTIQTQLFDARKKLRGMLGEEAQYYG